MALPVQGLFSSRGPSLAASSLDIPSLILEDCRRILPVPIQCLVGSD